MLTTTTQALARVQAQLHNPHGGHYAAERSRRRTPDGFSRELHMRMAMHLQRAVVDEWMQQQMLPTEAPNDPQHTLPGAA